MDFMNFQSTLLITPSRYDQATFVAPLPVCMDKGWFEYRYLREKVRQK